MDAVTDQAVTFQAVTFARILSEPARRVNQEQPSGAGAANLCAPAMTGCSGVEQGAAWPSWSGPDYYGTEVAAYGTKVTT